MPVAGRGHLVDRRARRAARRRRRACRRGARRPARCEALPCGSRSMTSTRLPCSASATARLTVLVVLPTPPFWLATVMIRRCGRRGASGARRGAAPAPPRGGLLRDRASAPRRRRRIVSVERPRGALGVRRRPIRSRHPLCAARRPAPGGRGRSPRRPPCSAGRRSPIAAPRRPRGGSTADRRGDGRAARRRVHLGRARTRPSARPAHPTRRARGGAAGRRVVQAGPRPRAVDDVTPSHRLRTPELLGPTALDRRRGSPRSGHDLASQSTRRASGSSEQTGGPAGRAPTVSRAARRRSRRRRPCAGRDQLGDAAQLSTCRSHSRGASRGPSRPRSHTRWLASGRRNAAARRPAEPERPTSGRRRRRPARGTSRLARDRPTTASALRETTTRRRGSSPSLSLTTPVDAATASWTTLRSNGVIGASRTGSPAVEDLLRRPRCPAPSARRAGAAPAGDVEHQPAALARRLLDASRVSSCSASSTSPWSPTSCRGPRRRRCSTTARPASTSRSMSPSKSRMSSSRSR